MDDLVSQLKALREARHIRQSEVAAAVGVDQSAVSLWEKGKTKPSGSARILLQRFIDERKPAPKRRPPSHRGGAAA